MFSASLVALALASSTLSGTVGLTPRSGCTCPHDLKGDDGVFINLLDAYQCSYPNGACTWLDQSGDLQNTDQSFCPRVVPCPASGCVCPNDNNGHFGVLFNQFKALQCAYPSGACIWDNTNGQLLNTFQTNCPNNAMCQA